jgi:multiple sugar transport system ATP-binding protein
MNFLPGELDGTHIKLPMVEADLPLPSGFTGKKKGTVIAGIRPENFEDASLVPAEDVGHGVKFRAPIEVIEWMGSELYAYFTVGGAAASELGRHADLTAEEVRAEEERTMVVARLNAASRAREGQEVELWLDGRAVRLFDPDTGLNLCLGDGDAPEAAPADTVESQSAPAAAPTPTAPAPSGGSSGQG